MKLPLAKNLLFDLGGVIINLDVPRTLQAFANLVQKDVSFVSQFLKEIDLFGRYEVGEWTDAEFRNAIRAGFQVDLTDEQIDEAWNAMLLDIPLERITLLQKLRKHYKLYLLSNTNGIHLQKVNEILAQSTEIPFLEMLFDKTYYSHIVGKSKPKAEVYEHVLQDAGITALDTLFLDDNADNITGAKHLGIQTVLIKPDSYTILDVFANAHP